MVGTEVCTGAGLVVAAGLEAPAVAVGMRLGSMVARLMKENYLPGKVLRGCWAARAER
jgi:hypothetical protein